MFGRFWKQLWQIRGNDAWPSFAGYDFSIFLSHGNLPIQSPASLGSFLAAHPHVTLNFMVTLLVN